MKIIFYLLFSIFLFANEYDNHEIAKALKSISAAYEIDERILYTIAKIESNFNPLVVSYTSKDDIYLFRKLHKKVSSYKNKLLITFTGNEKDLKEALKILIESGISVDVGIMQINSVNFSKNEIDNIFAPKYNIEKSMQILKSCIAKKVNLKDSIECYNKGINSKKVRSYKYFERFRQSFIKDFAELDE